MQTVSPSSIAGSPVEILHQLFALESRSIFRYLASCSYSVTLAEMAYRGPISATVQLNGRILQELSVWIEQQGGKLQAVAPALNLAGLHDVSLRHMVGLALVQKRQLADSYHAAIETMGRAGAPALHRFLLAAEREHREQLEQLESLTAS